MTRKLGGSTFARSLIFKFKTSAILNHYCLKFEPSPHISMPKLKKVVCLYFLSISVKSLRSKAHLLTLETGTKFHCEYKSLLLAVDQNISQGKRPELARKKETVVKKNLLIKKQKKITRVKKRQREDQHEENRKMTRKSIHSIPVLT